MKLVLSLLLLVNAIIAQDQDINQITGTSGTAPAKTKEAEAQKLEMDELRKELKELKAEIRDIKNKNQNEPEKKEPEKKEETNPEKKEDSTLDKVLDGVKKDNPENKNTYSGFSRDIFMTVQTPDFKKRIMDRYQWQVLFWTHGNYSNNSDLRKLDNTNLSSVDQTDDKTIFAAGGLQLDNYIPVHPRVDLRFDIWRFGFYGGDQLAGRDSNNDIKQTSSGANTLNFGQLYIDMHLKLNPTRNERLSLRVGRQDYRIGGKIFRDFHQEDILDAMVLKWYDKKFGRLDLLLIDLFSNSVDTRDVNFIRFLSSDNTTVKNLNGASATYRQGFIYRYPIFGESEFIGSHADIRVFYFYSKFSGSNQPFGGADRTNNGTSGNFADNDFSIMRGARFNFGYDKWFRSSFTYAESYGIDRKQPDQLVYNRDVGNGGKSYGAELEFAFWNRRIRITPTYFYADGGKYYANGVQHSHGFVSMKGDQVGGLLSDLYWGIHPSAYTSGQGIADLPYNRDRRSGTLSKHIGFAFGILENLFLKFDVWRLHDTSSISYLTASQPPPTQFWNNNDTGNTILQDLTIRSYSAYFPDNGTAINAARRFGSPLGEEYNAGIDWSIFRGFKIWATFGVFRPMRYYSTAGLVQGSPQGTTQFTAFQIGTSLIF
ncbi:MAG: hypothetical protein SFU98_19890 [Leptospiraceae bacterium]|nr:hypothetical protein [Leptospiraceae bacterium]